MPLNEMPYYPSLVGHVVAKRFSPGYIVLSYMVSFIGSWTTLELLNRRTRMKDAYNWYVNFEFLLVESMFYVTDHNQGYFS
jgi:hypothetical protein